MNAILDLNRNSEEGAKSIKVSVSQAASFTHPLSSCTNISFGSVNICVTNMKAEDFKISQQSLGHFRCVSASQGLLGTTGSRCEVPVY